MPCAALEARHCRVHVVGYARCYVWDGGYERARERIMKDRRTKAG